MGAPTGPRALNAAETRDRILKAAVEQFARNGFDGARIENICAEADVNPRMVYHYFADKAGLYLAVLEHVLGQLRTEELKLDMEASEPLDGLLQMFDFIFGHFAKHPELIRLLSAENLMQGTFLRGSEATPVVASPVIGQIRTLLRRGEADGALRRGIDPLHLYVTMVALSYFHKSNGYTLAIIFGAQVQSPAWYRKHYMLARAILEAYLAPEGSS